eukprot:1225794-Rhodomonas_salina.1
MLLLKPSTTDTSSEPVPRVRRTVRHGGERPTPLFGTTIYRPTQVSGTDIRSAVAMPCPVPNSSVVCRGGCEIKYTHRRLSYKMYEQQGRNPAIRAGYNGLSSDSRTHSVTGFQMIRVNVATDFEITVLRKRRANLGDEEGLREERDHALGAAYARLVPEFP